jgi:hypothetical protein
MDDILALLVGRAIDVVLNPFRCQSSLNLDWDRCAINRTCLKYGIAAIR